jgi:hypothetical protein
MGGFTHPMDILADVPWETRWPTGGALDRLADGLQQEPREQPVDQGRHE